MQIFSILLYMILYKPMLIAVQSLKKDSGIQRSIEYKLRIQLLQISERLSKGNYIAQHVERCIYTTCIYWIWILVSQDDSLNTESFWFNNRFLQEDVTKQTIPKNLLQVKGNHTIGNKEGYLHWHE